jgi:hypothetical protein
MTRVAVTDRSGMWSMVKVVEWRLNWKRNALEAAGESCSCGVRWFGRAQRMSERKS